MKEDERRQEEGRKRVELTVSRKAALPVDDTEASVAERLGC